MSQSKNVLGQDLDLCGCNPMTGWQRDGYCDTDEHDQGIHTVCCIVTDDFLNFSKLRGNDLSTPRPDFGFPGLKAGDHWCVCASRWLEAYQAGHACPVKLESTHEESLALIPMHALLEYRAIKSNL
jgi:uncharacterized protein